MSISSPVFLDSSSYGKTVDEIPTIFASVRCEESAVRTMKLSSVRCQEEKTPMEWKHKHFATGVEF